MIAAQSKNATQAKNVIQTTLDYGGPPAGPKLERGWSSIENTCMLHHLRHIYHYDLHYRSSKCRNNQCKSDEEG